MVRVMVAGILVPEGLVEMDQSSRIGLSVQSEELGKPWYRRLADAAVNCGVDGVASRPGWCLVSDVHVLCIWIGGTTRSLSRVQQL